jgi:tetratricopeptide (TPR) repeat protein
MDLQKYISFKPSDPDIHLWAGNLLFNIGAFEDAVKAYSHANNINKNEKILLIRAKCYMILKELNSALSDMSRIIEITNDKMVIFDRDSLTALKSASMSSS